jgi:hypothetical protein
VEREARLGEERARLLRLREDVGREAFPAVDVAHVGDGGGRDEDREVAVALRERDRHVVREGREVRLRRLRVEGRRVEPRLGGDRRVLAVEGEPAPLEAGGVRRVAGEADEDEPFGGLVLERSHRGLVEPRQGGEVEVDVLASQRVREERGGAQRVGVLPRDDAHVGVVEEKLGGFLRLLDERHRGEETGAAPSSYCRGRRRPRSPAQPSA